MASDSSLSALRQYPRVLSAPWSPAERRLLTWGLLLATLAVVGAVWGSQLAQLLNLQLNAHGHTHMYAHGHPFIDSRVLWGIPNAMDVLTNLPFLLASIAGLRALHRASGVQPVTRQAATVFFVGLGLTFFSSSFYHWAPQAWGLALDRAGMAVAFAGVLGLATAQRVSLRAARWTWLTVLVTGLFAILLQRLAGIIAPWAVVQFGGMAVVLWACTQRAQPGALGIRWGVLIGIYAAAKLLELGDAWVFDATQGWVSGHSLKHVVASLAALPVISALRHNALQMQAAAPQRNRVMGQTI